MNSKDWIIAILLLCLVCITSAASESGWSEVTSNASFSPRYGQSTAVFNDKLWVIGGTSDSGSFNDVWSSSDGKSWTLETDNAGFSPRFFHGTVVFDNKLWVIGGLSNYVAQNDIWSSSDGKRWTKVMTVWGFSPRYGHSTAVFNNKIWVIGGIKSDAMNDIWSSPDGSNWTLQTAEADFQPRYGAGVTEFNHRLWVVGGFYILPYGDLGIMSGPRVDVWSSRDGSTWELENSCAAFERREFVPLTAFDNKMWIIGGGGPEQYGGPKESDPIGYIFNDVWSSSDGINWTLETENAGFSPRYGNSVITFNNTIWSIGGIDDNGVKNDVWQMNIDMPIPTTTVPDQHVTDSPNETPTSVLTTKKANLVRYCQYSGILGIFGVTLVRKKNDNCKF